MEQRSVEKSTETVLISNTYLIFLSRYLLLYKTSNYEKYFANQNKDFDLFLERSKPPSTL
jgi:hypothetical protein